MIMEAAKSGSGSFPELTFQIIEGEHKNRLLWARLNLANPDGHETSCWEMRLPMSCKKIETHYDRAADVLYVSFGKPVVAVGIDIFPNVVLRISPSTRRIVGVTIIDAKRLLLRIARRIERTKGRR